MPRPQRPSVEERYATTFVGITTTGAAYDPNLRFQASQVKVYSRYYSGIRTPNYPNAHPLPFNGYSLSVFNSSAGTVDTTRSYYFDAPFSASSYGSRQKRVWSDGVDTARVLLHVEEAEAACLGRLADLFNKVEFNAAQFIAERQQFIDLVGRNARRIVHAARAVKQLRFGEAANALGVTLSARKSAALTRRAVAAAKKLPPPQRPGQYLATTWLELQYGWKPLLQDVHGAGRLLAERLSDPSNVTYARATASASKHEVWPYVDYTFGSVPNACTYRRKTTCKYIVAARASNEVAQKLAVTGISNPALLAWELVPFSFVVDWFLPVGNYLEQLNAYNGFEFIQCNKVLFTRGTLDMSFSRSYVTAIPYGVFSAYASGSGFAGGVRYERGAVSRPPTVPPVFKSPLSLVHTANALALLQTTFGRRI